MVPWDPWVYQQLFFPKAAAGEEKVRKVVVLKSHGGVDNVLNFRKIISRKNHKRALLSWMFTQQSVLELTLVLSFSASSGWLNCQEASIKFKSVWHHWWRRHFYQPSSCRHWDSGVCRGYCTGNRLSVDGGKAVGWFRNRWKYWSNFYIFFMRMIPKGTNWQVTFRSVAPFW